MNDRIEICDNNGNVVGHFTPQSAIDAETMEFVKSQVDLDALARRKQQQHGKGLTIDQLLEGLETPETSG